jgi:hypothetical protein
LTPVADEILQVMSRRYIVKLLRVGELDSSLEIIRSGGCRQANARKKG